jgi:tape measure domain-containing protein
MAVIREELELKDAFSSSLKTYIDMMNKGNVATAQVNAAMKRAEQNARLMSSSYRAAAQSARAEAAQSNAVAAAKRAETQSIRAAREAQRLLNEEKKTGISAASALTGTIRNLAGAYLGLQGIKGIAAMSDNITSATARLNMMNDGLQTTEQLNNMIFESAKRSRGEYQNTADMVSKLGILAGEAFNSSAEIVNFAEQINKQMVLSGTSTAGAQAAMLQLTQAMSSGVLRGEELNSVLEQTPLIAQNIAKYMGVTTGEMRNLASEGRITADVVKNAMFAAADETNAKFAQMPYTWSQVFTQFKNTAIQTFEPVLKVVGKMAQVTAENLDIIAPAFYGAAAAAIFFATATTIANGSLAAFAATLMATPLGWIALLIGIVVAATIQWIQQLGGVGIAWLTIKDSALTVLETMQIGIATFVTNAANGFGNLKAHVLMNFQEMVNGAIDGLNKLASTANAILGTSFGMLDHITIGTEAAIANEASQTTRNADLSNLKANVMANRLSRAVEISQRKAENAAGGSYNGGYAATIDGIAGDVGDIKGSAASISKAVDMSKEDIKSLVDVATRQYVNKINFNSQTPVINVSGANTGNTEADRKALADTIKDIIIEQAASSSYRPTAMPT